MTRGIVLLVAVLLTVTSAVAKVDRHGPTGFVVSLEVSVNAPPDQTYAAFLRIGQWWSKAHSFSGDAANMTIDVKAGGCWCEALPNGGFVKHMELASAMPPNSLVFKGGLGPMHFMAASGSMVVKFTKAATGTKTTLQYSVAGDDAGAFEKLSAAVDGVLAEQLNNYAAYAGKQ
jgi:uncharacterized protein YndB with AHSA1/START domain